MISKLNIILSMTLIIGSVMISNIAIGKELGKYGNVYPITEPDIVSEIERRLEHYERNGELEKFNNRYKEEIKRQIVRPNRVIGIVDAEKNSSRKYDPSTELEEDIKVPENKELSKLELDDTENIKYRVLYPKGTKINPLNYILFNEPLIFIDGDNKKQVEYANEYFDKNKMAKIILINGEPGEKKVGDNEYYYYFDQWGAYSMRFGITKVPSVVWQKEGEKVLTINEIGIK